PDPEHGAEPEHDLEPKHNATRIKSTSQGAATTVWASVTLGIEEFAGSYCEDCGPAEPRPSQNATYGYASWARDPEAAAALWTISERLVDD
ncbi:MAG: hypothetical protein IH940_04465, partial [Acidobacteria bacterium]|nr:hypothetical protein [Acidobacteriota bacterium]